MKYKNDCEWKLSKIGKNIGLVIITSNHYTEGHSRININQMDSKNWDW